LVGYGSEAFFPAPSRRRSGLRQPPGDVSLARREPLTEKIRPAITLRADAAASTTSRPAFVTIAIRPSCRVETTPIATDLGSLERRIFLRAGLDDPNQIDPSGEIGFSAQLFFAPDIEEFIIGRAFARSVPTQHD
jgi:hypothetical protein